MLKLMREELKMNSKYKTVGEELYEMVELLAKQVSPDSSEEKKVTILNDIKPSSFAWVIESVLNYIEVCEHEIHK